MSLVTDLIGGCFNGEAINEWAFNGAGSNPIPLQPYGTSLFDDMRPLILDASMMSALDACADLTIPCEPDTLIIPAEIEELVIL